VPSDTPAPTPQASPDVTLLKRHPYLQSLTQSSLVVSWATSEDVPGEVRVGVTSYRSATHRLPTGDWQHEADIAGLNAGTAYSYTLLVAGRPAYAASFRTAPAEGTVTFVAFGDAGSGREEQIAIRDRLAQTTFDLAVISGDVVYDRGTYDEWEARYFGVYRDLIDHLPFYTAPGNHDYVTDGAAPYLHLFSLPRQAWREGDQERYYSFDYGDVHFVAIDTNTPLYEIQGSVADDMADWLVADLRQTDRPWKVAFFHHPPYSSGPHGSLSLVHGELVPIFEDLGVHFVIAGHDHSYERTVPIRDEREAPFAHGGVVYIVTGGGGQVLYPVQTSWFTAFSRSVHHVTRFTLSGCEAQVEAIDISGAVFDSTKVGRC
jgi:3',5'-cyclic AMP phosphodiesterase CpdA